MKKVAKTETKVPVKGYAKGGPTSLQMKQLGRGLAKVANQEATSTPYKKGS